MKSVKQFFRIIQINWIMARHGFDRVVFSFSFFRPLRFLSYLNPLMWFKREKLTRGEALRSILEDLGPIFVKFGQLLSTRRDLIPDDIADELEKLQDQVPPFSNEKARQIIEKSLGAPVTELFKSFDEAPLASASIAQVHAATLQNGKAVIIKVRRPGIEKTIRRDIALMQTLAKLIEHCWSQGKRLRPREVVNEFEHTILTELDFMTEAANASQLRRNFLFSENMYVPEIHWPYCRDSVLVMERIHGVPVANVEELKRQNVDMKKLAEHGVEIFFTQVFRDSFFHADMHPGNLFISTKDPKNPVYIAVDFGIMGSLSDTDQRYLAENLLGFFHRDYRRIAELHVESGWVPSDTRVVEFEAAIRSVCEPIFEKPLKDISFGQLLVRLFQTASRFNMEIQPQLLLLQKTLLQIESLGRRLYPELDLWETGKPFLEKWAKKRYHPRALLRRAMDLSPQWAERIIEMPNLVYDTLHKMKQIESQEIIEVEKKNIRGTLFIVGVALIGACVVGFSTLDLSHSAQTFAMSIIGGVGVLSLLAALLSK